MFKVTDKIGEIAAKFPDAMKLFQEYKIDFCCGGNRPLQEAITEQNINESVFIKKLNKAYEEKKKILSKEDHDWEYKPFGELIDYIINKHHRFLKEKLPDISELSTTLLRVHGLNHKELQRVHRLFHNLKLDLDQHLIKEEEVLFPAINNYENNKTAENLNKAISIINELEAEHENAGDILKELRKITIDYNIPSDGCKTYELTYLLLEELEDDLFKHIHLENNILFPRLKKEKEVLTSK